MKFPLVLLAVLLFSLVLAGCPQPPKPPSSVETPPEPTPEPGIEETLKQLEQQRLLESLGCVGYGSVDECYFERALQAGSEGPCQDIQDAAYRDRCYAEIGKRMNSTSSCLKISVPSALETCLFGIAQAKNDGSVCAQIPPGSMHDRCIKEIKEPQDKFNTFFTEFGKLCQRLPTDAEVTSCIALPRSGVNFAMCDLFAKTDKEDCLVRVAKYLNTFDVCHDLRDTSLRNECMQARALYSRQVDDCRKLSGEEPVALCMKAVAVSVKSEAACRKIQVTRHPQIRSDCLEEVAKAAGDLSSCLSIGSPEQRGLCAGDIAVTQKQINLCAKVPNTSLSDLDPYLAPDACYLFAAIKLLDPKGCDFVYLEARKEACKAGVLDGRVPDPIPQKTYAVEDPRTCSEINGFQCNADQNCLGRVVSTVDVIGCCLGSCRDPDECSTNADCDDSFPGTIDECRGSPKKCRHITVTACAHNDQVCPTGCYYDNDNDCPADACQTDADCSDSNPATQDKCNTKIRPHVCEHADNPYIVP